MTRSTPTPNPTFSSSIFKVHWQPQHQRIDSASSSNSTSSSRSLSSSTSFTSASTSASASTASLSGPGPCSIPTPALAVLGRVTSTYPHISVYKFTQGELLIYSPALSTHSISKSNIRTPTTSTPVPLHHINHNTGVYGSSSSSSRSHPPSPLSSIFSTTHHHITTPHSDSDPEPMPVFGAHHKIAGEVVLHDHQLRKARAGSGSASGGKLFVFLEGTLSISPNSIDVDGSVTPIGSGPSNTFCASTRRRHTFFSTFLSFPVHQGRTLRASSSMTSAASSSTLSFSPSPSLSSSTTTTTARSSFNSLHSTFSRLTLGSRSRSVTPRTRNNNENNDKSRSESESRNAPSSFFDAFSFGKHRRSNRYRYRGGGDQIRESWSSSDLRSVPPVVRSQNQNRSASQSRGGQGRGRSLTSYYPDPEFETTVSQQQQQLSGLAFPFEFDLSPGPQQQPSNSSSSDRNPLPPSYPCAGYYYSRKTADNNQHEQKQKLKPSPPSPQKQHQHHHHHQRQSFATDTNFSLPDSGGGVGACSSSAENGNVEIQYIIKVIWDAGNGSSSPSSAFERTALDDDDDRQQQQSPVLWEIPVQIRPDLDLGSDANVNSSFVPGIHHNHHHHEEEEFHSERDQRDGNGIRHDTGTGSTIVSSDFHDRHHPDARGQGFGHRRREDDNFFISPDGDHGRDRDREWSGPGLRREHGLFGLREADRDFHRDRHLYRRYEHEQAQEPQQQQQHRHRQERQHQQKQEQLRQVQELQAQGGGGGPGPGEVEGKVEGAGGWTEMPLKPEDASSSSMMMMMDACGDDRFVNLAGAGNFHRGRPPVPFRCAITLPTTLTFLRSEGTIPFFVVFKLLPPMMMMMAQGSGWGPEPMLTPTCPSKPKTAATKTTTTTPTMTAMTSPFRTITNLNARLKSTTASNKKKKKKKNRECSSSGLDFKDRDENIPHGAYDLDRLDPDRERDLDLDSDLDTPFPSPSSNSTSISMSSSSSSSYSTSTSNSYRRLSRSKSKSNPNLKSNKVRNIDMNMTSVTGTNTTTATPRFFSELELECELRRQRELAKEIASDATISVVLVRQVEVCELLGGSSNNGNNKMGLMGSRSVGGVEKREKKEKEREREKRMLTVTVPGATVVAVSSGSGSDLSPSSSSSSPLNSGESTSGGSVGGLLKNLGNGVVRRPGSRNGGGRFPGLPATPRLKPPRTPVPTMTGLPGFSADLVPPVPPVPVVAKEDGYYQHHHRHTLVPPPPLTSLQQAHKRSSSTPTTSSSTSTSVPTTPKATTTAQRATATAASYPVCVPGQAAPAPTHARVVFTSTCKVSRAMCLGFPKRPRMKVNKEVVESGGLLTKSGGGLEAEMERRKEQLRKQTEAAAALPDGLNKSKIVLREGMSMLPSLEYDGISVKYFLEVSMLVAAQDSCLRARIPVRIV